MANESNDEVQVHGGRPTGITVSVRLKPDEAQLLTALSRRYEATLSETLRLALHSLGGASDYTTLRVQSSGLGSFTRGTIEEQTLVTA
jgi:hypothetical protein